VDLSVVPQGNSRFTRGLSTATAVSERNFPAPSADSEYSEISCAATATELHNLTLH